MSKFKEDFLKVYLLGKKDNPAVIDDTLNINSLYLLRANNKDSSFVGKVTRHRDGTITITRGKELKQYFKQN